MPSTTKTRLIAVEEHFSTEESFAETEKLVVFPGEEAERDIMATFPKNPTMHSRLADLETRLKEMDGSGTDLSVLSLNRPGAQMYNDTDRATALAGRMNDVLADIIKAHPQRFWGDRQHRTAKSGQGGARG